MEINLDSIFKALEGKGEEFCDPFTIGNGRFNCGLGNKSVYVVSIHRRKFLRRYFISPILVAEKVHYLMLLLYCIVFFLWSKQEFNPFLGPTTSVSKAGGIGDLEA